MRRSGGRAIASSVIAETSCRIAATPKGPTSGKIVAPNAAPTCTEEAETTTPAIRLRREAGESAAASDIGWSVAVRGPRIAAAVSEGPPSLCAMQTTRAVRPFRVVSDYTPSGDQPTAIAELATRVKAGESDIVLLGATGTGKSATTAWLIEQVQRPTLVLAHNKTLAAQLANEFRELMPDNAVEYFVSYYDYYQPEAYVPQTDTFIEKDSSINSEVERLRHSTTNSLLSRRDVIVVSTVSCIYGLGAAEEYLEAMVALQVGQRISRDALVRGFIAMQYQRNDIDFSRGRFRVRGDTIEIIPMYEEHAVRIEMFGDEVEALYALHPLTGDVISSLDAVSIFPATHYAASPATMQRAIGTIQEELHDRLGELKRESKLLEEQRLRMRTSFDLEMMEQIGFCNGIENYSRHIDGRMPGQPPHCLLDYFPDDFLTVIDESHVTVPQIGAMYEGDASRKRVLVEHGFRLPVGARQPPAHLGRVLGPGRPDRLPVGDAGQVRARHGGRRGGADHPPHRAHRPGDRDQAVQGPGRRPARGDPGARRASRAGARHHAHEEERGGPHGLPRRGRGPGPLPPRRRRHPAPRRAADGAAPGRLRRAHRHQPAAGGPRPARGVARRDPRRRQGGLPPLVHVPDPDDRARRPQRVRPGAHVRRHGSPPRWRRRSRRRTGVARSRSSTTG